MALKDPTAWLEDLTHYIEDEELAGTAEQMGTSLVMGSDGIRAAVWVALVGLAAGMLGAITMSPAIRASMFSFLAYLTIAAILLRGFRPLTIRIFGSSVAWLASLAFFWAFLLGLVTMLGARRESSVWAYVLSVGMGFFLGMMNGALQPGVIRREDAWMSASLLAAPVTAAAATYAVRHAGTADSIGAAAFVGIASSGLYTAIMSVMLARLWNEAHGLGRMGLLYLHNDNFASKAVEYFDRAIALSPDDAPLYNLRGLAYSKMGDPGRAAADWRQASELAPEDAEPHVNLAADFLRRGDLDQAIAVLHQAIGTDPKAAKAYSNLGMAYERRGDFDLAIQQYDRAISLKTDYADAYSNRGFAYYRKGDHTRALEDCEQAIALNDRFATAYVNRGHALAALGRPGDAADSYRAAINAGAEPGVRDEAYRRLEALGMSDEDDDDE